MMRVLSGYRALHRDPSEEPSPELSRFAWERWVGFVVMLIGCTGIEVFPSSITGGDGNIEFFMGARRG